MSEQKWISVNDRLPDYLVDVLVFDEDEKISIDCMIVTKTHRFTFEQAGDHLTHWMPLPKSPEVTK